MQLSVLHKRFSLLRTDTKVDADSEPNHFFGHKFHMLMSWIQYHDFQLSILWFPFGHRILQTIANLATAVYISINEPNFHPLNFIGILTTSG